MNNTNTNTTEARIMRRALLSTRTILKDRFASEARKNAILDMAADAPMFADARDLVERSIKAIRIYEAASHIDRPQIEPRINKMLLLVEEELGV